MAEILLDLPIGSSPDRVFDTISTPQGLDRWWTWASDGVAQLGATWRLCFGSDIEWRARVIAARKPHEFVLEIAEAAPDWIGTRIEFRLVRGNDTTWLQFRHTGWRQAGDHFRVSCNCWAMYLRLLRRSLEYGEFVEYEDRLTA